MKKSLFLLLLIGLASCNCYRTRVCIDDPDIQTVCSPVPCCRCNPCRCDPCRCACDEAPE